MNKENIKMYTMEQSSALEKMRMWSFQANDGIENILNELTQSQKDKSGTYYHIPRYEFWMMSTL